MGRIRYRDIKNAEISTCVQDGHKYLTEENRGITILNKGNKIFPYFFYLGVTFNKLITYI